MSIFRNVGWGGVSAGVRLATGLVNLGLAVSLLGSAQYGHAALVAALAMIMLSAANSFFTIATSTLISARSRGERPSELQKGIEGIWTFTAIVSLTVITIAVGFDAALARLWVYEGPDPLYAAQIRKVVGIVGFATALQIITACNVALVESTGRFDLAARMQLVAPTFILVALAIALVGKAAITLPVYAWILVAATGSEAIAASVLRARLSGSIGFRVSLSGIMRLPAMLRGAGKLQGANLVNVLFDPLNKYLLNRFFGASTVTHYDAGMKIAMGIQQLFNGAFRSFLQLSSRNAGEISNAFEKVIRMTWVPAVLMHGAAAAALALIGQFWLSREIATTLPFFGALLPASLGIIFITPLYFVLIGIGDLAFVLRMHVILAVVNLIAALLLIPRFGLFGAAAGLVIATVYNVYAAFGRYRERIGAIAGLSATLRAMSIRLCVAATVAMAASFAVLVARTSPIYWLMELALLFIAVVIAVREPVLNYAIQRLRGAH